MLVILISILYHPDSNKQKSCGGFSDIASKNSSFDSDSPARGLQSTAEDTGTCPQAYINKFVVFVEEQPEDFASDRARKGLLCTAVFPHFTVHVHRVCFVVPHYPLFSAQFVFW